MRMNRLMLFAVPALTAAVSLSLQAQTVATQIFLPNQIVEGIAANPVTNLIYVVAPSGYPDQDDSVAVIDGTTDTIVANIDVPIGAYYPAVDIAANKIYVATCNNFLNPAPCSVTVIDGTQNTVIASIPVTSVKNGFLSGITVNPLTHQVYVSDNKNNDIAVIDGNSSTLTGTIGLNGAGPWGLSVNPFNNLLYVTLGSSQLDIINTQTNAISSVSTGAGTSDYNLTIDLLTGHLFVSNTQFGPSTVAVLDQNGALLAQVPVGQAAYGVDVDPVTNLAFVAEENDDNTGVISGKSNTRVADAEATFASFIAVNPVTQKVYGAGNGLVTVSTETANDKPLATVTLNHLVRMYTSYPTGIFDTTDPAGLPVSITYNGSSRAPTSPGAYMIIAGVTSPLYGGAAYGTFMLVPSQPKITIGNLNPTYTGSPIAATATSYPAGLPITLTYNGSTTPPTAAGTYTVTATISQPDYASTASATMTIGKATAAVTLGGLNQTYNGSPLPVTVSTNPAGLSYTLVYDHSTTAPTAAGTYVVVATIVDPNYVGRAAQVMTIAQATATVSFNPQSLQQTYNGHSLPVQATTTPAGLLVNFTYNGSTKAPSAAGSYSVVGTISDRNYIGTATATETINPAPSR